MSQLIIINYQLEKGQVAQVVAAEFVNSAKKCLGGGVFLAFQALFLYSVFRKVIIKVMRK